jgi:hypothetical protein
MNHAYTPEIQKENLKGNKFIVKHGLMESLNRCLVFPESLKLPRFCTLTYHRVDKVIHVTGKFWCSDSSKMAKVAQDYCLVYHTHNPDGAVLLPGRLFEGSRSCCH